jgi:phage-related protein
LVKVCSKSEPRGEKALRDQSFCTAIGEEIVILMTVIKKSNQLPKRHIDTARVRMKEIQQQ